MVEIKAPALQLIAWRTSSLPPTPSSAAGVAAVTAAACWLGPMRGVQIVGPIRSHSADPSVGEMTPPLLNRLIDAVTTAGSGFGGVELLYAAALLEQIVLAGPTGLLDAEPEEIRAFPEQVALYHRLLDRFDEAANE